MTNLTSSEMLEIITRSVQETAKELSPFKTIARGADGPRSSNREVALIFVSGMVAGALVGQRSMILTSPSR